MRYFFRYLPLLLLFLSLTACKKEDAATTTGTASNEPATQQAYEQAQAAFADNHFEQAITALTNAPQETAEAQADITLEIEGIRLYQNILKSYENDQLKAAQNKLSGQTIDPQNYQVAYVKLNAIKKAIQRESQNPRRSSTKTKQQVSSTSTTSVESTNQLQTSSTSSTADPSVIEPTGLSSSELKEKPQLADWQVVAAEPADATLTIALKNDTAQPMELASEKLRLRFYDGTELFPDQLVTELAQPDQIVSFPAVFRNFSEQQLAQGFELVYDEDLLLNQAPAPAEVAVKKVDELLQARGLTDFTTQVIEENGTLIIEAVSNQDQQSLGRFKVNEQNELEAIE